MGHHMKVFSDDDNGSTSWLEVDSRQPENVIIRAQGRVTDSRQLATVEIRFRRQPTAVGLRRDLILALLSLSRAIRAYCGIAGLRQTVQQATLCVALLSPAESSRRDEARAAWFAYVDAGSDLKWRDVCPEEVWNAAWAASKGAACEPILGGCIARDETILGGCMARDPNSCQQAMSRRAPGNQRGAV